MVCFSVPLPNTLSWITRLQPRGGPFIWNKDDDTPAQHQLPPIPNTQEWLNRFKTLTWGSLDTGTCISYFKAGLRKLAFPPRMVKDFEYISFAHLVGLSHQTKTSILANSNPVWVTEKCKLINHLSSISDVDQIFPSYPISGGYCVWRWSAE